MQTISVLGMKISQGSYRDFISTIMRLSESKKGAYACVANVHMLVEAHRSRDFASIVNNAQVVTPDGKPLTWALRLLRGIRQERVAGMDLLPDLLSAAADEKVPVYFYGGQQEVLERTRSFIADRYPNLEVAGLHSPPFRKLSEAEEEETVQLINRSGARLVFVILGCPKQERWMSAMKDRINAVMIGVGGALPVLVGTQRRAPVWMQRTGFEWLYRLGQEPKRLFKRYAVTNSIFLFLLFKACLGKFVLPKRFAASGTSTLTND